MLHSTNGDSLSDALLTGSALPHEHCRGTNQAVIVERQNHRNPARLCCMKNGGRHKRKGIVKVADIRSIYAQQFLKLPKSSPIPQSLASDPQRTHGRERIVVRGATGELMTAAFDHLRLSREHIILTAR